VVNNRSKEISIIVLDSWSRILPTPPQDKPASTTDPGILF